MRIVLIILGTVITVAGLIGLYSRHSPASSKTLADDGLQRFDFGNAWVLSEIDHDFILENHSERDLSIEHIESSCGCLVAREQPSVIPARGTVRLPVRAQITSAVGNDRFAEQVLVRLKDAPPRMLQITGNIVFNAPAGIVDVGTFLAGTSGAPAHFELRAENDAVPLEIVQAVFDQKLLDVTWSTRESTRSILDVEARIKSTPLDRGDFNTSIQFVTNDPKKPARAVYLRGRVICELEAEPRELNFGLLKPDEPRDLWIKVYSPLQKPVVIKEIEIAPQDLFEVLERREEGTAVWLNIQMKSAFKVKTISHGKVRVAARVGDGETASCEIPAFGAKAD